LQKKGALSWHKLQQRLALTGDSEPEVVINLRLIMGLGLLMYFCLPWGDGETFQQAIRSFPSLITLSYYICALMIAVALIINPKPSPTRRVMGLSLDLISLSIVMFMAGEDSVYLFVLYLWVILGNGFRYGTKYLYISLFIGLTGFSIAITWGDYWQITEHQPIGLSLLFLLLLIPLYTAFLISKLHAAIATAKFANEAKSRFLANMSHELRTPLNGVIGIADLIRETNLNNQQREFVNIMHNSANTLLGLIENVLDISKIEAGKITIAHDDFDLHQLVNLMMQMQTPMGKAKNIIVTSHIDAQTPFSLQGDPQHLRQVLINLMGNAIKFTNAGSVKLFIRPADNKPDKPRIRFEIQDTGIGIPESALATLFDHFTQVESSASRSISGTGLGTTISKELIELMGGEIGVETQPDIGSTFWFELPFTSIPNEHLKLSDKHILLLTSDETTSTISPALNSWGVTYNHVSSSARALSLLMQAVEDNNEYKIMLVDQSCIFDIDPVQYAQMIKAEPSLNHLSLVLINSSGGSVYNSQIREYYISAIHDLKETRLLFNAIHAAQSVNIDDDKVVTLSEYFAQQDNAKALKILIADDNRVNQQVLKGVLNHAGHHTLVADSGEKALDILADNIDTIDMLILDMNMPELSGFEVMQALQYMDTANTIPVIILTADATPEAKEKSLNAGANAFLTKPINARALLDQIAKLTRINSDNKKSTRKITKQENTNEISSWFDQDVIDELTLLGGGDQFIQQLVNGFKKDGEKHITLIKQTAKDDFLGYRESLHALKGSATELGATRLVKLCLQAEALKPYDTGTSRMFSLTSQIEKAFESTVSVLENNLASPQLKLHPRL
tara:strand:- start:52229 stop:54772 length:2544 start_codon:yes stop_codon:yes gene_type:complete